MDILTSEVIVRPGILIATVLVALGFLISGFYRVSSTVDDVEVKNTKFKKERLKTAGIALLIGVAAYLTIVEVPFGHRGVIWSATGGVQAEERQPGISFVVPVLQRAVIVDVRTQRFSTVAQSGDDAGKANAFVQNEELLDYTVKATLNWHIDPERANEIVDEVGPDYVNVVINPNVYDAVREAVGDHTAVQLAANVELAQAAAEAIIAPILEPHGIVVESFAFEDVIPPTAFSDAVELEEVADREADRQENLERAAIAEKNIRITQAEAGAEELRQQGIGERARITEIAASLGFTPDQYLRWLTLQKWDGILPDTLLGGAGGFDVILDLANTTESNAG